MEMDQGDIDLVTERVIVSKTPIKTDKHSQEENLDDTFEKDLIEQAFDTSQVPSGKTLQEEELKELNEIEKSRESENEVLDDVPEDIPFKELVLNFEKHLEDHNREIEEIQNRQSFRESSTPSEEEEPPKNLHLSKIEVDEEDQVEIFEEEDIETKKLIKKLDIKPTLNELSEHEDEEDDDEESLPSPPSPATPRKTDPIDLSDDLQPSEPEQLETSEIEQEMSNSIRLPISVFGDLKTVRDLFLENGYNDIDLKESTSPLEVSHLSTILKNVQQLFLDFRKRGRVLESVDQNENSEVDLLRRRNQRLETDLDTLRLKNKTQVNKMNHKYKHVDTVLKTERKKHSDENKKYTTELSRLRKTNQNLRQKHQKSSHSLKIEESKNRRLQSDLVSSQKMNASTLLRAEKLFTQYYKKKPRPADPKEQKEMQLVRFLQHKLQNTQKHVRFLEKKVSQMSSQKGGRKVGGYVQTISPSSFKKGARKNLGTPFRKGRVTTTRPSQVLGTPSPPSTPLGETRENGPVKSSSRGGGSNELRRMSETVSSLRMELEGMKQERSNEVHDLDQKLRISLDRVKSLEWENQEMVRELQKRPTMEMYESLKAKHDLILEKARAAQVLGRSDFKELNATKEDLNKEKSYLKEQTAKRMILRILEVLDLERTGDLIPTLKKTRVLVRAIPKLRNFVYRVLKIVREGQRFLSTSSLAKRKKSSFSSSEEEEDGIFQFINIASRDVTSQVVPGILESWASLLLELQSYKDMEKKLVRLYSKLESSSSQQQQQQKRKNRSGFYDGESFQYISSDLSHGILKKKILTMTHELITRSNKTRRVDETFEFLESSKSDPKNVHRNLIHHFMRLFEVKKMNGVLPKMNTLYRSTNELRNMLNILREIFELPMNCGLKDIVQHAQKMNGDLLEGIVQL